MNLSDLKNPGGLVQNPRAVFYAKWTAVYAGILIAAVAAGIHLSSSGAKTRAEAEAIRARLASMPEANTDAAQRAAMIESIKKSAEIENRQFIPASDIPSVLSGISASAARHQITLKKVNTLAAKEIGTFPYRAIPFLMEFEGSFENTGNFLLELKSGMPWNFTLERALMKKHPKNSNLQTELRIVFYTRPE